MLKRALRFTVGYVVISAVTANLILTARMLKEISDISKGVPTTPPVRPATISSPLDFIKTVHASYEEVFQETYGQYFRKQLQFPVTEERYN